MTGSSAGSTSKSSRTSGSTGSPGRAIARTRSPHDWVSSTRLTRPGRRSSRPSGSSSSASTKSRRTSERRAAPVSRSAAGVGLATTTGTTTSGSEDTAVSELGGLGGLGGLAGLGVASSTGSAASTEASADSGSSTSAATGSRTTIWLASRATRPRASVRSPSAPMTRVESPSGTANGAPCSSREMLVWRLPAPVSSASISSRLWGTTTRRPSRSRPRRGVCSTWWTAVQGSPRQVRPSRIRIPCASATSSGVRASTRPTSQ